MNKSYVDFISTPLGWLKLSSNGKSLVAIDFVERPPRSARRPHSFFKLARRQLAQYFSGRRRAFSVPLQLSGSPWQNKVWLKLAQIPWGAVISYGDLAVASGRPRAARAIGRTVGANLLPIIIPCHRVLAAGAKLGGYSGGLSKKIRLLKLEGHSFDLS